MAHDRTPGWDQGTQAERIATSPTGDREDPSAAVLKKLAYLMLKLLGDLITAIRKCGSFVGSGERLDHGWRNRRCIVRAELYHWLPDHRY